MSRVEPERNRYVGHRYVPKIFGEWDNQNEYEGLSIVTHQGTSYTSKKRVPVGIDILNDEFWVVTGNYNAQVEYYRQETERISDELKDKTDQTYVDTEVGKKADKTYVDSELLSVNNTLNEKSNQSYVDTELSKKPNVINDTLELKIPTDFTRVSEAIEYLNSHFINEGTKVNILIERGHRPIIRESFVNMSLNNIELSSVDEIVYLGNELLNNQNLFMFNNSQGFTLNCLIDMEGKGYHGMYLTRSSIANVNVGCGVINAGSNGLYARGGSTSFAEYSIFTGAAQTNSDGAGITSWGGVVNATGADVSGSLGYGARAAHGGVLDFDNGKADNVGYHGIRATQNGTVTCRNSSAKNAGIHGIYAYNASTINAREADASGAKQTGFRAGASSHINAYSGIADGCDTGVYALENSGIDFRGGRANDSKTTGLLAEYTSRIEATSVRALGGGVQHRGVDANGASTINITLGNIRGSRLSNVRARNGSTINAPQATIRDTPLDNASAHNVISQNGSFINLQGSTVVYSGGKDLYTQFGGIINAHECKTTGNAVANIQEPDIEDTSSLSFNSLTHQGYILGR